jgi:dolichyl-phosphate-mannose--protein O-mannosyl transferase
MREQISSYDPALAGASRATPAQIRSIYLGGFTGAAHVAPGPAITLAWSGYFVLLAIIGNRRAYAHIRTTCALALIGLVGFWIDTATRHEDGGHPMRRRILVILVTLIAATVYFRLRPGV